MARFDTLASTLRNRDYRLYVTGNFVSLVGWWMQRLGVGWLAWDLTGSGAWLGLIALADLAPSVLLAVPGGVLADRYPRRRLIVAIQALMLVQAAVLAAMTWLGAITIGWLLALTLLLGCLGSLNQPSRLAFVSLLVPREHLASAIGLNSGTFNLARLIGPMLAGYTIAFGGVALNFAINAATFLCFIVAMLMLRLRPQDAAVVKAGFTTDSLAGFTYVANHAGIRAIMLLLLAQAITARGFTELLPALADGLHARGALGLAWLTASVGLGALVGSVAMATRHSTTGLTRLSIWYTLGLSLALIAIAAAPWFELALVAAAAAGFNYVCSGVGLQTLVQSAVTPSMRGRVLALYGMIFRAGPAFGAFAIGAASEWIGLRWAISVGAVLCIAAWWVAHLHRTAMAQAIEHHGDRPP